MSQENLLRLTADIVVAFVGHNPIIEDALPELIRSVHSALIQSIAGSGSLGDQMVGRSDMNTTPGIVRVSSLPRTPSGDVVEGVLVRRFPERTRNPR
jgi:hypothetical protein